MNAGFLSQRVVHVHPTLHCNLTCVHCYSSSSPSSRAELDAGALVAALAELRSEGYEVVSLSGGEPFLYRELDVLVGGAAELGYGINVVTNATVLTERRLGVVADRLSFVAVSLDGAPATHDRIRGRDGAFAAARRGIEVLRASGVPFGITFCVTAGSLPDVPEVYELAVELGARLLNLRPLALVGRATALADREGLDAADRARLALLADILDQDPDVDLAVRVDLAPAAVLRAEAEEAHPLLRDDGMVRPMSDLVNPVIVDDSGRLLPFAYGLHPRFAVAASLDRLAEQIAAFKHGGVVALRMLLREALADLPRTQGATIDWFDHLTRASHRLGSTAARV
jgi:Fe-coproporphyrin III synthase